MRIIDRYLLRMDLRAFVILFASLTGLYVVFDAFSNLDEFLKYSERSGNLLVTMGQYYAYRAVFLFDRTAGILALLAAMFTVAVLQRQNELTALWAAGLPSRRLIRPIVGLTIAMALAAAANRELVIPRFREGLVRESKDLVGDVAQTMQPRYDNHTEILLQGKHTYAAERRITEPDFLLPPELADYGRHLTAENAFFQDAHDGRPSGYLLRGVQKPPQLSSLPGLRLGDRLVLITHHEAPDWIGSDECFVTSELTFEQLARGRAWRQFSSTLELISDLRNPSLDYGADVRVKIHGRVVQPLLDVTLLMLGLPLVISPGSRNLFVAAGLAMGVVGLAMLTSLACQYLGAVSLVSPALAAWLPALILVPLAALVSQRLWE